MPHSLHQLDTRETQISALPLNQGTRQEHQGQSAVLMLRGQVLAVFSLPRLSGMGRFLSAATVCFDFCLPPLRQLWPILCRSLLQRVLVKSNANGWSARMQFYWSVLMQWSGQINAITHCDAYVRKLTD